jgi:formate/nitrite transporter FocA (FNT family)
MYFIPLGMFLRDNPAVLQAAGKTVEQLSKLTLRGFFANLLPVTLGNIVGGAGLVAIVYWFVYLRRKEGINERI